MLASKRDTERTPAGEYLNNCRLFGLFHFNDLRLVRCSRNKYKLTESCKQNEKQLTFGINRYVLLNAKLHQNIVKMCMLDRVQEEDNKNAITYKQQI